MRVLLRPCMCLAKHASNFVHFVVGSLKGTSNLVSFLLRKKKEFLPQRCTRGLLCFGNSTQHSFMLPRVVEIRVWNVFPISDPHIRPPSQAPNLRPPISGPSSQTPHLRPPISDPLSQTPHLRPPISGPDNVRPYTFLSRLQYQAPACNV